MIPAEQQLAVLTEMVARIPDRPDTRTPGERARDDWLEDRAIARAEERQLSPSDREQDRQADLYFGGA